MLRQTGDDVLLDDDVIGQDDRRPDNGRLDRSHEHGACPQVRVESHSRPTRDTMGVEPASRVARGVVIRAESTNLPPP
jgi:hypothetical protein